jgi:oligoribonuclease (3'-5' exoribonuclease)
VHTAQLAGNSVHFDARFLRANGPDVAENDGQLIWKKILDHLHYRLVQFSVVYDDVRLCTELLVSETLDVPGLVLI